MVTKIYVLEDEKIMEMDSLMIVMNVLNTIEVYIKMFKVQNTCYVYFIIIIKKLVVLSLSLSKSQV